MTEIKAREDQILEELSKIINDFRKNEDCFHLASSFCSPPWSQTMDNVSGAFTHARLVLEDIEHELEKFFNDIKKVSTQDTKDSS